MEMHNGMWDVGRERSCTNWEWTAREWRRGRGDKTRNLGVGGLAALVGLINCQVVVVSFLGRFLNRYQNRGQHRTMGQTTQTAVGRDGAADGSGGGWLGDVTWRGLAKPLPEQSHQHTIHSSGERSKSGKIIKSICNISKMATYSVASSLTPNNQVGRFSVGI